LLDLLEFKLTSSPRITMIFYFTFVLTLEKLHITSESLYINLKVPLELSVLQLVLHLLTCSSVAMQTR